jgi:YbgC/YbaW family acyl-CoA thioester hydrolase
MPPSLNVQIAWGDCDEQGIVFYPNYFYWMDSAFQALLRRAGLSLRLIRNDLGAVGLPLVEARAHFVAAASYDEALTIDAAVSHWGRTSFQVGYRARRNDELVFEGHEARVWAVRRPDNSVGPAPIPVRFRDMLSAAALS